ncbi:MAG: hypothetical protein ACREF3_03410, partial [Acetobacteraceae bacterium]
TAVPATRWPMPAAATAVPATRWRSHNAATSRAPPNDWGRVTGRRVAASGDSPRPAPHGN